MAKRQTPGLTADQIAYIEVMIEERKLRTASALRTGETVVCSYKGDAGLRDALLQFSKAEGLNLGECFNLAVEALLLGRQERKI